ncbi:hypothetical protein DOTSEDRAFT_74615 [Dothistroma septosporum NZE10]|uniref:Uncharacterized protein n=1 Tax=Dothistroma septosporum (strain NZE10 / CBS 128990) TaxID=675120 RepID=N1PCN1_DOTSN|nr:hypothetical protein DOTSEDRAFT_74615 [Dothistroma septosporum NZE10]
MPGYAWLLSALEEQRRAFARITAYLPSHLNKFKKWDKLLRDGDASSKAQSKAATYNRTRARVLLLDVLSHFGLEVCVLFALSASQSRLAPIKLNDLLPELEQWWADSLLPPTLVSYAAALRRIYAKEDWISTALASNRSGATNLVSQLGKRKASDIVKSIGPSQHEPHKLMDEPANAIIATTATPSDCTVLPQPSQGEIAPGPVLDFRLSQLLACLQQRGAGNISLQMKCPFTGDPLPFIVANEDSSVGLSGRLSLSLQLSEALLKYMLP